METNKRRKRERFGKTSFHYPQNSYCNICGDFKKICKKAYQQKIKLCVDHWEEKYGKK